MMPELGSILPEDRPLYTVYEAAVILCLDHTTIRRYLKQGKLTHLKVGKRTVIPKADLEALISRR
jgi:excisionase family DNA binding protein